MYKIINIVLLLLKIFRLFYIKWSKGIRSFIVLLLGIVNIIVYN